MVRFTGVSGRLGIQNQRTRIERRRSSVANSTIVQHVRPRRNSSTSSTGAPYHPNHVSKELNIPETNGGYRPSIADLIPTDTGHLNALTALEAGSDAWQQISQRLAPQIAVTKQTTPEEEEEGEGGEEEDEEEV